MKGSRGTCQSLDAVAINEGFQQGVENFVILYVETFTISTFKLQVNFKPIFIH